LIRRNKGKIYLSNEEKLKEGLAALAFLSARYMYCSSFKEPHL